MRTRIISDALWLISEEYDLPLLKIQKCMLLIRKKKTDKHTLIVYSLNIHCVLCQYLFSNEEPYLYVRHCILHQRVVSFVELIKLIEIKYDIFEFKISVTTNWNRWNDPFRSKLIEIENVQHLWQFYTCIMYLVVIDLQWTEIKGTSQGPTATISSDAKDVCQSLHFRFPLSIE